MKRLTVFLFGILIFVLTASTISADYGQYGEPSPSEDILVDKFVGKVVSTTKGGVANLEYVDNLSASDPRFVPGQEVMFQLKIKNISNNKLISVEVKDFVPSYVTAIEGPGTFDEGTRTITFNAGDFNVDEEKFYYIKMQILPQGQLPSDKGLFCLTNKARATGGTSADEDASQFCVEKQVTGTTKVPQAGPEFGLLLISGEALALGAGIFLRKRSL